MRAVFLTTSKAIGVFATVFGFSAAQATDYQVTTGVTQTSGVTLNTGGDTLTVDTGGALSVAGVPVIVNQTSGTVTITNDGTITSNLSGVPNPPAVPAVPAIFFNAAAGTHLVIDNSGVITARRGSAFVANQVSTQTGSVDFDNSGVINSFTNGGGIAIGSYFGAAALRFGAGADTLTNSGTINGDVFMGLGNDTVNILTGSVVNGAIYGDDGSALSHDTTTADIVANAGTINFIGSIATKTGAQEVGRVELFQNVHFVSGYWTLTDNIYGGIFTVDPGATVELRDDNSAFREFVYTAFNDLGTPLINNGHIVFYNDLTRYSTDDGLNINIAGSGTLDLYNTAGSNTGVFQFGATGGFGGGLNLHGGTVLLVSTYTGDINVMDGGVLRIGGNLIDDPNSSDPRDLVLGTGGGVSGNVVGNLNIDGTLILDRSDSFTYAGNLTGTGLIIKQGNGAATLSGTFNYTGDMQILAGFVNLTGNVVNTGTTSIGNSLLRVNGSISSDVSVSSGGTLGGSGSVHGDVTVGAGGTVGPGNSPGTLNVDGHFTFSPGSIYAVETTPSGVGDRITVTGGAAAIGSNVTVNVLAGGTTYSPITDYTILSATGGVSGSFAHLTTNLAFLTPELIYGPNSVTLRLLRNDIDFDAFAQSANQHAVAGVIGDLDLNDPLYLAVLNLSGAGAAKAYAGLSGDTHATLQSDALTGALSFTSLLGNRLSPLSEGPQRVQLASLSDDIGAGGPGASVWMEALGASGSIDSRAGAANLDNSRAGLGAGFDTAPGPNSRIGAALAYTNADLTSSDRDAHARADIYDAALYGGVNWGSFVARGALDYSWRAIDARRTTVVGVLTEHLRANYNAQALTLSAELARPFILGDGGLFETFLGVAHISLDTDGFHETGGASALAVGDASADVTFLSLGARGRAPLGRTSWLYGSLAWRHASGDVVPQDTVAFASNPGSRFIVAGSPIGEDTADIEAGLRLDLGGVALSASYHGAFSDNAQDNGARLRANWSF